jgi:hypothetical protein
LVAQQRVVRGARRAGRVAGGQHEGAAVAGEADLQAVGARARTGVGEQGDAPPARRVPQRGGIGPAGQQVVAALQQAERRDPRAVRAPGDAVDEAEARRLAFVEDGDLPQRDAGRLGLCRCPPVEGACAERAR